MSIKVFLNSNNNLEFLNHVSSPDNKLSLSLELSGWVPGSQNLIHKSPYLWIHRNMQIPDEETRNRKKQAEGYS